MPTFWGYPEFPGYQADLPYGSHKFKTTLISLKLFCWIWYL